MQLLSVARMCGPDMGTDMKQILLSGLIAAAFLGSAQSAFSQSDMPASSVTESQTEMSVSEGFSYLFPAEISGTRFEMPKQEFLDLLTAKGLSYSAYADNTVYMVEFSNADFSAIIFKFNSNAGQILTEIEFRFSDMVKAASYAAKHYPPDESQFTAYGDPPEFYAANEHETYRVKAWQFGVKVFFVAAMPNTRWSNQ